MNYDLEMEKQIKNLKGKPRLLLHACCAPCSSAVLERISQYFDITILYYNPNITEKEEYENSIEGILELSTNLEKELQEIDITYATEKQKILLIEENIQNEKIRIRKSLCKAF